MEWTYQQSTGNMIDPDGVVIGEGYSGKGAGLNNPEMQGVVDVGPIPQGCYELKAWHNDPKLGRLVGDFVPDAATRKFILSLGRDPDSFRMHGDNQSADFSASEGCVVANHTNRLQVSQSHITAWRVIA